jgi:hypothetical protein
MLDMHTQDIAVEVHMLSVACWQPDPAAQDDSLPAGEVLQCGQQPQCCRQPLPAIQQRAQVQAQLLERCANAQDTSVPIASCQLQARAAQLQGAEPGEEMKRKYISTLACTVMPQDLSHRLRARGGRHMHAQGPRAMALVAPLTRQGHTWTGCGAAAAGLQHRQAYR